MEDKWKEYLDNFEKKVMIPLFESDCALMKTEPVPLSPGKLQGGLFGKAVGKCFTYDGMLAFNYYGLFKLSSTIIDHKKGLLILQKKAVILSPVIHFSSIKIEHIEQFSKEMLLDFVAFKRYIVFLRWSCPT